MQTAALVMSAISAVIGTTSLILARRSYHRTVRATRKES